MARRELATAATELLIINRPSSRDIEIVEHRFRLHPLDVEALFSVPQKSSGQTYGQYVRLSLTWPELVGGRLRLADAVFLTSPEALAIISHHSSPVLDAVIGVWESQAKNDQRSAVELLLDCLAIIARSTESAAGVAAVHPDLITHLTTALEIVPVAAEKLNMPLTSDLVQRLAIIQHRLKYVSEMMLTAKHSLKPFASANSRLHRLIRGYALASAGVIILVIVSISR